MDYIRGGHGTHWGGRRAGFLHCADAIGIYQCQHESDHTVNADS